MTELPPDEPTDPIPAGGDDGDELLWDAPDIEPPRDRKHPHHRRRVALALATLVATLLLALGGILSLFFKGSSSSSKSESSSASSGAAAPTTRPSPTSAVPSLGALGATGQELEAAIAAERGAVYHATYNVTAPQLAQGVTETLEVWRRLSSVRTDVTDKSATGTAHSSATVSGASSIACSTKNGVEKCAKSTSGPIDLPESFAAEVASAASAADLTVTDDTILGVHARCFAATGIGSLCLRADGALLRADLHGTRAEATTIDDNVPADIFTPNLTGTTVPTTAAPTTTTSAPPPTSS